jgi:flagellar hook-associated protein 2
MALTANGVGSGLDINGLVKQLMEVEAQPLNKLNTKEASFQSKLSAFGQIKSLLTPLQSALSGLKNLSSFQKMQGTLADTSLASLIVTGTPTKATRNFEVTQIAQGQRLTTSSTTAPTVAAGTLTFEFGSYSTDVDEITSFSATTTKTVTLGAGVDTLAEMRDAINDAKIGVRAQIVNNGTADQLVIASTSEGRESAFRLSGSAGVSGFSYDESTGATSSLTALEKSQDAKIILDGITLTRKSNSISDAIEGLTINLLKADPGKKTTLSIDNDRSAVKSSIENLVKAYNEFNTSARSLSAYNPDTRTAAVLTGDATVRGMLSQIRNDLGGAVASGGNITNLSQVGLDFDRNGTLSLNAAKLDAALKNPDNKVGEFFAGKDGVDGLASRLSKRLSGYLESKGIVESRMDGIKGSIKLIDAQRETISLRLETIENRYRKQFTTLDTLIGQLTSTSSYLQQQLAALPNTSKK